MSGWVFVLLWVAFAIVGGQLATWMNEAVIPLISAGSLDKTAMNRAMTNVAFVSIVTASIAPAFQWFLLKRNNVRHPSLLAWLFLIVVLPTFVVTVLAAAWVTNGSPDWLPRGEDNVREWFFSTWVFLPFFMLAVLPYAFAFLIVSPRMAAGIVLAGFIAALMNFFIRNAFGLVSLPVIVGGTDLSDFLPSLIGGGILHALLATAILISSTGHRSINLARERFT